MKIGIDYRPVTVSHYSGIAKQVLAIEQAINNSKHKVYRFTCCPENHSHRDSCFCPESFIPTNGIHRPQNRIIFESCFLYKEIRKKNLDIYIATANLGLPLPPKRKNTKYVLLLHDLFQLTIKNNHSSKLKMHTYRALDWLSIWYSVFVADLIITPSNYSARNIIKLFPRCAGKVRVIHNSVPSRELKKSSDIPRFNKPYWLIVGTREPRKNIPWFIECWSKLRDSIEGVPDLVLVGNLEDTPNHLRSIPGLIHLNNLDEDTLTSLYFNADCLWQPSYAEGFGLPVIEALGQGTPVAIASGSALSEICPPDTPTFAPNDSQTLKSIMHSFVQKSNHPYNKTNASYFINWAKKFDQTEYETKLLKTLEELN